MLQNENVEIESVHNKKGMPPSVFSDIKDEDLRDKNRGAILANIFERYIDKEKNRIIPRDLALCTRELDNYLSRLPKSDRKRAWAKALIHLEERGYAYGS